MKKISDLIKENESLKQYVYTAKVDIRGFVTAHDEGEAGELTDQAIDELSQYTIVDNYEIINIEATNEDMYVNQSVLSDDEEQQIRTEFEESVKSLTEKSNTMSQYGKAMFFEMLKQELNK